VDPKSTLLKSLIGLLTLLSGKRVFPIGRIPRSGYVPQVHRVDPVYPLTSLQVVLQGPYGLIGLGRFPIPPYSGWSETRRRRNRGRRWIGTQAPVLGGYSR
jgi:hypothetical protein